MDGEVASTLMLSLASEFTPKHFSSLAGLVATGRWCRWAGKGDAVSVVVYGSAELGWPMHSPFQSQRHFSQGLRRQLQTLSVGHCKGRRQHRTLGWQCREVAGLGGSVCGLSLIMSLYIHAPDFLHAARQLPPLLLLWELESLPQT